MSKLELQLAAQIADSDLPAPEREYRFAAVVVGLGPGIRARLEQAGYCDWRFDFAWPGERVAAEVEGGIWARGRHVRGLGFRQDCTKYNAAALLGWRVLRFTASMLNDDFAIVMLKQAMGTKGERI